MKNKLEQIAKVRKQLAKHSKKLANFEKMQRRARSFFNFNLCGKYERHKKTFRDYDIFLKN